MNAQIRALNDLYARAERATVTTRPYSIETGFRFCEIREAIMEARRRFRVGPYLGTPAHVYHYDVWNPGVVTTETSTEIGVKISIGAGVSREVMVPRGSAGLRLHDEMTT